MGLFYLVPVVKTFSLTCVLLYLAVIPAPRVHEFPDASSAARGSHYVV
jgi:hypothetical protein